MAALVLLLAAAPSVAAPARQSMTYPIAYGQSARNLINHRHHAWLYYFEARRGDRVTITVDALDGDLDPFISLRDAAGNVLAEDDDSGPGTNARLVYDVRRDGRYDIFVTRYQGELAPSAGRFELRLEGAPNGMFGPPQQGGRSSATGRARRPTSPPGSPPRGMCSPAGAAIRLNLGVALRSGDFTPRAEVYLPGSARPFLDLTADASRRILAEGVTLPLTGYYAIRVAAAPTDAAGVDGGVQISLQGAAGTPRSARRARRSTALRPARIPRAC
ncbi:MAG: PPC domain-containing protein [Anaerolineae bacterium]|nr:PPC domain-containing protein [Anaerolineae bacterium]